MEETPLMKQYFEIKNKYNDCIVFFRLGDFYEMFGEDALISSKILNITLTARNKIPMCGIPYHSSNQYIPKLLNSGHKIAICEQLEKPTKGTKIVDRNVVRVITKGTVLEENLLDEKDNNYLVSIYPLKKGFGISNVDISTGDINSTFIEGNFLDSKILSYISKLSPKEIILPQFCSSDEKFLKLLSGLAVSFIKNDEDFVFDFQDNKLVEIYADFVKPSLNLLFFYINRNYKESLKILKKINIYKDSNILYLSENTINHLELVENNWTKSRKYSLLDILDNTKTPMGSRLLKKWILAPLYDLEELVFRQEIVTFFYENYSLTKDLAFILASINDIERICSRVSCNINFPRDLIFIKNVLKSVPEIISLLENIENNDVIKIFIENLKEEYFVLLYNILESSIVENPPNNLKDGNIIKNGFDENLDRLRSIKTNGKQILLEYENEEKERTKISNLKIKFNNIFGYFFEVTKLYKNIVPIDFIRVQTLSNCERYTSEKLKKYEVDILEADEESILLENKIYNEIRFNIQKNIHLLHKLIFSITHLDVFSSFAINAVENNFVRPFLHDGYDTIIKNGRHPVIESISKSFVPNDTLFLENDCRFYLITGPNMAGKSTYLRQVALITLMAQIGSFVPSDEAKIALVDKIFTRIGSGDKLVKGESTFLVEMKEASYILKEATSKSLVILDEVGRGTSTFDGISIAWVIADELANRRWLSKLDKKNIIGPKTLFATHYLELISLENEIIKNYSFLVDDTHGEVNFLHKITKGNSSKSYGIHVAKIAGLPLPLIEEAKKKLKELEKITIPHKEID